MQKNSSYTKLLLLVCVFSTLQADKFSKGTQSLVNFSDTGTRKATFIEAQLLNLGFDPATMPYSFDFSGFIKNESFLDSRQTFDFGRGQFLLFPLKQENDVLGCDINSRGRYNMAAIESRLRTHVKGPKIGSAHSRAYVECDFFGNVEFGLIDTVQMRHAFVEIIKDNLHFVAGQTYHPLSLPLEAPNTVSFNSGVPMEPFLFSPQFRVTYTQNSFTIINALVGDITLIADGPRGPSNVYFRDSMMPEFHIQGRVDYSENFFFGAAFNLKRQVPRIKTDLNYKSVEILTSLACDAYFGFTKGRMSIYGKTIYVEDGNDFVMIGGYATSCVNQTNDKRQYANFRFVSAWTEIVYDMDRIEPALFVGFGKNLGTTRPIIQSIDDKKTIYGFGNDIATIARISPRVRCYYFAPFLVGAELEMTRAAYGTVSDAGKVENAVPVNNLRLELACYYIF